MTLRRRGWLAASAAAFLGACALGRAVAPERIVDTGTGRSLESAELLVRLRASDVVLLGELHDNPHHHTRRAELLAGIGAPTAVVMEQLPRGAAPVLPAGADRAAVERVLVAAGFDAEGWDWPAHEPLFGAAAQAGHVVLGGNLPRELVRRIAREGADALPATLRELVDAAPLPAPARRALEDDLQRGHCGQLPAARMPGMVWAQRGRDASMAEALRDALAQRARGPVLLIAGNGHVRRDYGVPQLLAALLPGRRLLSVAFLEAGDAAPASEHDIVWTTPAAPRSDPCEGLRMTRPAA